MAPPTSDRYQKWIGMWLCRRRSDEIHCTMKRAAKTNWPMKPIRTQKSQLRGSKLISRPPPPSFELLANPVRQHPLAHPPHGQAIGQSSEGAVHRAVL